jgi:hypothetical protein
MNEILQTSGVIPVEQALPRFSIREDRLGMSHQDWFNTFLSRLVAFDAECQELGQVTTMIDFANAVHSEGSPNSMALLGGVIRQWSGLEGKKGNPMKVVPVSVTELGAQAIVDHYAAQTTGKRYYKSRKQPC